jgi:hypothetical protein
MKVRRIILPHRPTKAGKEGVRMQPVTPRIRSKAPSMRMKTASLEFPTLKTTLQRPGRREMSRSPRKSAMPPRIAGSGSANVVALMKSSLM